MSRKFGSLDGKPDPDDERTNKLDWWYRCPECLSFDIDGGPIDIDGLTVSQSMGCLKCDSSWTDEYEANIKSDIVVG